MGIRNDSVVIFPVTVIPRSTCNYRWLISQLSAIAATLQIRQVIASFIQLANFAIAVTLQIRRRSDIINVNICWALPVLHCTAVCDLHVHAASISLLEATAIYVVYVSCNHPGPDLGTVPIVI